MLCGRAQGSQTVVLDPMRGWKWLRGGPWHGSWVGKSKERVASPLANQECCQIAYHQSWAGSWGGQRCHSHGVKILRREMEISGWKQKQRKGVKLTKTEWETRSKQAYPSHCKIRFWIWFLFVYVQWNGFITKFQSLVCSWEWHRFIYHFRGSRYHQVWELLLYGIQIQLHIILSFWASAACLLSSMLVREVSVLSLIFARMDGFPEPCFYTVMPSRELVLSALFLGLCPIKLGSR